MVKLKLNVLNIILKSCRSLYFMCWLWHDQYIINDPVYFNYIGDVPPWEWTSSKVKLTDEEKQKPGETRKFKMIVWFKPVLHFHGEQSHLMLIFVNSHNYEEFIFILTFIWTTHLRNELLEIYWVDEIIGFGLRVRPSKSKKLKVSVMNTATWMAMDDFDEEESIFMAHIEFPSLWQTADDKTKRRVKGAFGLTYYINSNWQDGEINVEDPTLLFFTDRSVNDKNIKRLIYIYYCLYNYNIYNK